MGIKMCKAVPTKDEQVEQVEQDIELGFPAPKYTDHPEFSESSTDTDGVDYKVVDTALCLIEGGAVSEACQLLQLDCSTDSQTDAEHAVYKAFPQYLKFKAFYDFAEMLVPTKYSSEIESQLIRLIMLSPCTLPDPITDHVSTAVAIRNRVLNCKLKRH